MENKELKPLPKVGEYYHFWDDGKTGSSRHYICKVERIVPIREAKNVIVASSQRNGTSKYLSLIDAWIAEKRAADFLYAPKTDYFIEASCPKYDDNNLWFARTKDGEWFSMDIQCWWQSGVLDVDEKIFNNVIEYWENEDDWEMIDKYNSCEY